MSATTSRNASSLQMDLELALQTHRALFDTLHAEVRQASIDFEQARSRLSRQRGPVRGGSHYLARPSRERMTTLPMGGLVDPRTDRMFG